MTIPWHQGETGPIFPCVTSLRAETEMPPVAASSDCRANISPRGRRRRRRFGFQMTAVALLMLGGFVALGTAWYWRSLMFIPTALAAYGFLQAHRNTCVLRAKEGTFEHEDYSTTTVAADEVAVSRRVAAGIRRDAVLIGVVSAAISMSLSLTMVR
jgi:hypothetical protein